MLAVPSVCFHIQRIFLLLSMSFKRTHTSCNLFEECALHGVVCILHVRWIYDFWLFYIIQFSVFPWQVRRFLFGRICFSNYHLIRFRKFHSLPLTCSLQRLFMPPLYRWNDMCGSKAKKNKTRTNVNHMLKSMIVLIGYGAHSNSQRIYINKTINEKFILLSSFPC